MKHKEQKRREGAARNEKWRALSKSQQVQELNRRLGNGVGARRQREKLS